jgi:hypothetical protein
MSFPGGEEGEGEGEVVLWGMVKSRRKIFVGPANPSVGWGDNGGLVLCFVGVRGKGAVVKGKRRGGGGSRKGVKRKE